MIVVIDNYDSFVHNLARFLRLAGAETEVIRNDAIDATGIERLGPSALVISPGPGQPSDAGCSVEAVRRLGDRVPILGVCLGHQAIVEAYGGRVSRAPEPRHGHTCRLRHDGSGLFAGVPSPLTVCRYHSLAADPGALPERLRPIAWTEDGVLMALEHNAQPVFGVQFHPEAILTESGQLMIENFVRTADTTEESSP